jgi:hypothetical protein
MYKRFEMRRAVERMPIELITPHWDIPLGFLATDITARGAYIQSEIMPSPGEHIVCSFEMYNGQPEYCLFGEVSRVNLFRRKSDQVGRPGFGVQFLDATPFDRLQIRRALKGLPPPVPTPRRKAGVVYIYAK